MHVNIKDILAQEVGVSTNFEIANEVPDLADVSLTEPLHGELRLVRTNAGVIASGKVGACVSLQCHRCLSSFSSSQNPIFAAEFTFQPGVDQWAIEPDGSIDIGPLVRQEILLSLPIKQLCRSNCLGLCAVCGQPKDPGHKHTGSEVRHRPRIISRSETRQSN